MLNACKFRQDVIYHQDLHTNVLYLPMWNGSLGSKCKGQERETEWVKLPLRLSVLWSSYSFRMTQYVIQKGHSAQPASSRDIREGPALPAWDPCQTYFQTLHMYLASFLINLPCGLEPDDHTATCLGFSSPLQSPFIPLHISPSSCLVPSSGLCDAAKNSKRFDYVDCPFGSLFRTFRNFCTSQSFVLIGMYMCSPLYFFCL